ncbi:photosystem II protein PsbQ [Gloeocapsopsis dulcis]|nr:photosystem II protein PsbQ [Gloeocapsopsis dulcis]WNN91766.1 photosystem II protein PsbQ [Gloeocapsopsis dulcis]
MTLFISRQKYSQIMARYRSILSLILVIVTTFLVSCSSPSVAKAPPTYTAAQVEQIQQYVPDIVTLRDRLDNELITLIKRRDWIDVSNFIHGPGGEMRLKMTYVARNLLPQDQSQAREATRSLFDHLVKIEQAAEAADYQKATLNSREALADIDSFLQLIPKPTVLPQESEA